MRCKRPMVTPPDASVGTRPATCFTAAASSRSPRLSSRSRSAPAASASSICSGVLTSASTRRRGEAAALARRTASPTPPAAAAWLSFTRIPSNSAPRWFPPPPARTAAFSSARIPGLVLRVSSRRVRVPRSAWAYRWVSVAMPQRRCRRFSAVRSALSNPRRRPRTRSTPAPAAAASPSPSKGASSQSASSARKTRAAAETPETISGSLATTSAVPRACGGTQASAVRSPGPTSSSSASSMRRPTASPGRPRSSGTATGRGFIRSRRAMNSVAPPYRRRLPPRAASLACLLAAALLLALGGAAARFRGRAPGRLLRLGLAARLGGRLPGALAASGCLLRRALRPGRLGRLGQPLLQLGRVLRHLLQLLLGALHAGLQHVGGLFHQSAGEVLHPGKRLRRGALAASARRGRARLAALRRTAVAARTAFGPRPVASAVSGPAGPAVRAHLVHAAVPLLGLLAARAAVAPALLLVHSILRSRDAIQVARQLVPFLFQLCRAGAVLLDHFGRRALEEARVVQAFRDAGELPFQLLQLLLHARLLGGEVDQAGEGEVHLHLGLDVHCGLARPWRARRQHLHLGRVGQAGEGLAMRLEQPVRRRIARREHQWHGLVGRQVHLAADAARAVDRAHQGVHLGFRPRVDERVRCRVALDHDRWRVAPALGQALPHFLGHERHERVQEAQRALERLEQRRLRSGALRGSAVAVQRRFGQLDGT